MDEIFKGDENWIKIVDKQCGEWEQGNEETKPKHGNTHRPI